MAQQINYKSFNADPQSPEAWLVYSLQKNLMKLRKDAQYKLSANDKVQGNLVADALIHGFLVVVTSFPHLAQFP